jgi:hypothetical protein
MRCKSHQNTAIPCLARFYVVYFVYVLDFVATVAGV